MPGRPQDVEPSSTPTFKTLVNFDGSNGASPIAGLVQGTDGNFYGTTAGGGTSTACDGSCGTVFKITPEGKLTTLHGFDPADGDTPNGLVQGTDGNFYGTASYGGTGHNPNCPDHGYIGCGTVFKITPSGKLTTLHSFDYTDGAFPAAGLVQGTDGNFYGTTIYGGAGQNPNCIGTDDFGCGTVFKITPEGKLATLHSFDYPDGEYPNGLVQGADGNLYGTAQSGGTSGNPNCAGYGGCGTVFKITPGGTLTVLHSFDSTDGDGPNGALVQGTDGNFYGTAQFGGTGSNPNCAGCGTVFKITSAGSLTTLHSFDYTDGYRPYAGLVQGTDGNLYGTTSQGGTGSNPNCLSEYAPPGCGTVFKITPKGALTTLHNFDYTDGAFPTAGLVQGTGGTFYGTSESGAYYGTVFSLSVGLGPFVETRPTSGKPGAAVEILGNSLTGATSVTFNGSAASFKVVSSSEITATVPADATTGKVEVKTPSRTLSSNIVFRVTPTISDFSPTDGPVGTSVEITGESLAGATSVTFGGFRSINIMVVSDTRIIAEVPKGAKTGKIEVTTPGGTATSTENFTVN